MIVLKIVDRVTVTEKDNGDMVRINTNSNTQTFVGECGTDIVRFKAELQLKSKTAQGTGTVDNSGYGALFGPSFLTEKC